MDDPDNGAGTFGGSMGEGPRPAAFTGQRLLLFGTGSLAAALLPFWVNWFRYFYPEPAMRVVISRSAERFVTRSSLAPLLGRDVPLDVWPEQAGAEVRHVDFTEWPDTIAIYPATMNFITRFALGMADTPMLAALQCTTAATVVAPTLPPGGDRNPTIERHIQDLMRRPNVDVVNPLPARSASSRKGGGTAAPPLPVVLEHLEKLRLRHE